MSKITHILLILLLMCSIKTETISNPSPDNPHDPDNPDDLFSNLNIDDLNSKINALLAEFGQKETETQVK